MSSFSYSKGPSRVVLEATEVDGVWVVLRHVESWSYSWKFEPEITGISDEIHEKIMQRIMEGNVFVTQDPSWFRTFGAM